MHICYNIQSFHKLDLNPYNTLPTVTFGNNSHLQAEGIGSVILLLPGKHGGKPKEWLIEKVLYLPTAGANLFSVKQVSGQNGRVVFEDDKCSVSINKKLIYE